MNTRDEYHAERIGRGAPAGWLVAVPVSLAIWAIIGIVVWLLI